MTPACCVECENLEGNRCNYAQCPEWRAWFTKEWTRIREAAERLQEKPVEPDKRGKIIIYRKTERGGDR